MAASASVADPARGGGTICCFKSVVPNPAHYVSPSSLSSYPDLRLYSRDGVYFSLNRAVFAARSDLGDLLVGVIESPATMITELTAKDLSEVVRFLVTGTVSVGVSSEGFRQLGIHPPFSEMDKTMINNDRTEGNSSSSQWRPESHGSPNGATDDIFVVEEPAAHRVIDPATKDRIPSSNLIHSVDTEDLDGSSDIEQPTFLKDSDFEAVEELKFEITDDKTDSDEIPIQYFDTSDEENLEPRTRNGLGSDSSRSINLRSSDTESFLEDYDFLDSNCDRNICDRGGDGDLTGRYRSPSRPLNESEFLFLRGLRDRDLCRDFNISSTLEVQLKRLKTGRKKKHNNRSKKKKRVDLKNLTCRILEEAKARTVGINGGTDSPDLYNQNFGKGGLC